MYPLRATFVLLIAALCLLAVTTAHATIGIEPIPDQDIPSGKTLVVPIVATDSSGDARTYTVSIGSPTVGGNPTSVAGVTAAFRTGDPHLVVAVTYTDSNNVLHSGTMEFMMMREFAPVTTQIIGGFSQGGYYNPQTTGSSPFVLFNRVVPNFFIQLGGVDTGDGRGGFGFTFENEFASPLIFSGTFGQLSMANGGTNFNGATNGSQYFITLSPQRDLDFQHTIFGQLVRGADTLTALSQVTLSSTTVLVDGNPEKSIPLDPIKITGAALTFQGTDALLLLSGTGICDSVITVTGSDISGDTATAQFTAHVVDDSGNNDPPFIVPAPVNTTAPNGDYKLTLSGTDLQLDQLRYGFQRLLPAEDAESTSGTSQLLTIPLVSNTGNDIGSFLDHWNPSQRGPDDRVFLVAANDKPLKGTLNLAPEHRYSANTLHTDNFAPAIASFTSGNPKLTGSNFTASVNWGDGAYISGTNVPIVKAGSKFEVMASHTYSSPGQYLLAVDIDSDGGARLVLSGTINISATPLAVANNEIYSKGGIIKNQAIGVFSDAGPSSTGTDYTSYIIWGDGSISRSALKEISAARFEILGSHVYQSSGDYTLSTTAVRNDVSGEFGVSWSGAHITGVSGSQIFPPFPQAHLAQMWTNLGVALTDSDSIVTSGTLGGDPYAGLISGSDGNFYGTTTEGGTNAFGTVYQLTSTGSLNTIHTFGGSTDGANPYAPLTQGTNGLLYGTTNTSGSNGEGTVFELTTSGSFATLYSFSGEDGATPYSPVVMGTNGFLYGTTFSGGGDGYGTIFKLSTSGSFGTPGTITTLHTFTSGADDGGNPYSGLLLAKDGNFYGTTVHGTTDNDGVIYKMTASGSTSTIYIFTDGTDGANPHGGLIEGTPGTFYGTATAGGTNGYGTVFSVTSSGSFATLYAFTNGNDGANPYATLATGTDGNFYGTTVNGGVYGYGTVFEITPNGGFSSLYSFTGMDDGRNPYGALCSASNGLFYGTTEIGGSNGFGTLFETTYGGDLTTLDAFGSGSSFQYSMRAGVAVINSGNRPSTSGTFSVYAENEDFLSPLDGQQVQLTSSGQTSFDIPALNPGQYSLFTFYLEGTAVDTRLKFPVGFIPTDMQIRGVVDYHDPVGDFDGSQKDYNPPFDGSAALPTSQSGL